MRDEAEGTQYRGQFIRATLQVTGHNFNFIPRVSESLKVIKQQKGTKFSIKT